MLYINLSFNIKSDFSIASSISLLYSVSGIRKIVFFKLFSLKYFLIVFICDSAFTPAEITFFGLFLILFVNDKNVTSLNSSKY